LLEGELAYAEDADDPRGGVVLAGSHPMLGGNMHNNVVRGLGDGLANHGWTTLRFNYRGVGRSEGPAVDVACHMAEFFKTSHVEGEMDLWQDVQGAAAFLQSILGPAPPLVLIGYSFGCALLPSLCRTEAPAAVVLIAPPLGKHDLLSFPRSAWERKSGTLCVPSGQREDATQSVTPVRSHAERGNEEGMPILTIVSTDDFTLEPARLQSWFDRLPGPKRLTQAAADNHFFRGHEPWLVQTASDFLAEHA
jgi:alpha/beta superfamily hydrolase